MDEMEIRDWISIFAIILAPIIALQIQKWLESFRERRLRKKAVFRTLMTTRANRVSIDHVEALNMIDVEFYNVDKVIQAWRVYHDFLSNSDNLEGSAWVSKSEDLFTTLLREMGLDVGYKFDDVMLKRTAYSPIAHGNLEFEQQTIRQGLVKVFSGEKSFPILVTNAENEQLDDVNN